MRPQSSTADAAGTALELAVVRTAAVIASVDLGVYIYNSITESDNSSEKGDGNNKPTKNERAQQKRDRKNSKNTKSSESKYGEEV